MQYDRYRPAPPDALIDDLTALRPRRVLDVGCGTGKAAAALAGRGLAVVGVEPDERMAQVARSHGVSVEVATFEAWDAADRRFDLLTFADSWHWVDPDVGIAKAARLLRAGGTIARWWNNCVLDEPVIAAFDAVYRSHAPEVVQMWRPAGDRAKVHADARSVSTGTGPFTTGGMFCTVETRTYRWERVLTADQWVGAVATTSSHQRLEPPRLASVLRDLHDAIERLGGTMQGHYETDLVFARRA